jgi:hypothetical protein
MMADPLPVRVRARSDLRAAPRAAGAPVTVVALPSTVNLELYQGDDFAVTLVVSNPDGTDADLTGCTAEAQIRATPADATVAATFTATVAGNLVQLGLAHTDTATLAGATVWDCQLVQAAGQITTLVAGTVTITSEVTRP